VTARDFNTVGLSSLTALNQRLIAAAGEVPTDPTDDSLFAGEVGYVDPDTVDEDKAAEVRGRFSSEDPFGFNRVREWIEATIFNGEATNMSPLIGAFINEWAAEMAPTGSQFPTDLAEQMLNNEDFVAGAGYLPIRTQLDEMPSVFRTEIEVEGAMVPVRVSNDPLTGPRFTIEQPVEEVVSRYVSLLPPDRAKAARGQVSGEAPSTIGSADAMERGGIAAGADVGRQPGIAVGGARTDDPAQTVLDGLDRFVRNPRQIPDYIRDQVDRSKRALPFISGADFLERLGPRTSGGGGGGGGGAVRDIEFDRNHLVAQTADMYNNWFLDPNPAPDAVVGGIVDRYVREARAFWSGKGGQLDFDTYVRTALRALPRWGRIYEHKTPGQSEEEFLASFAQPIGGLGQTAEFTRMQTESAVTSGAGPAEQLKRVSRSREVEQGGGFSRRLANTLSGVGIG
jgi:hypothetical protein